jgi:hypothetical protein
MLVSFTCFSFRSFNFFDEAHGCVELRGLNAVGVDAVQRIAESVDCGSEIVVRVVHVMPSLVEWFEELL